MSAHKHTNAMKNANQLNTLGGRYEIQNELGRGGMGRVYRARDTVTGASVALKQLTRKAKDDLTSHHNRLRFQQEFHILASLKHPHIVEAYAFGYDNDVPFYTMELLDGQDLKSLGPLDPQEACRILREVASALSLLHARGLLHRDLAPRNVRCTSKGKGKLLDFGIICSMGVHDDLAGTPPFIAPEVVRGLPLDQRVDIFGLGAMAYWLLTGRNAYPVKGFDKLGEAWRQRPVVPSSLVPGIDSRVDELVMSSLSLDPSRRPANMAVVTNRLGAILGPELSEQVEVEDSFLASSTMVGRDEEMLEIKRRLTALGQGEGGVIFIESPLGGGKSRLLDESALEAQLAGLIPLSVNILSTNTGPFSVFQQLADQLFDLLPEGALAAAKPRAGHLVRVIPELVDYLGPITLEPLEGDAVQERARLQEELTQWLLEIAETEPLLLLVDDIHHCDEASATIFATLALQPSLRNILLLFTARTNETIRAPASVQAMKDTAFTLPLRDLSFSEIEALIIELLGDTPEIEIVTTTMSSLAGDTPMHCVEMVRHLIEIDALRHHEGVWIIDAPLLEEASLPKGLAGMFEHQILKLSSSSRALLEVISIYGGELELEDCLWLAPEIDEDEILEALNELTSALVLMSASGKLRFRHDGLRQACLHLLDASRRQKLHLHVGTTLEQRKTRETEPEVVGWHLLKGGQTTRAAKYLEGGGRRFFEMYAFGEALQPLEQALKIYEEEGSHPRQRAEILYMLIQGGSQASRETVNRYSEQAIDILWTAAGMDLADRLARWVGRPMGLVLGVFGKSIGRLFQSRERRGMLPSEALTRLGPIFGMCVAVYAVPFQLDVVEKLLQRFEFLFQAIKHPASWAMQHIVESMLAFQLSHYEKVRHRTSLVLELMKDRRMAKINEIDRKNIEGTTRYLRAMLLMIGRDPSFIDEVDRLEKLEMHFHRVSATVVQISNNLFRGDVTLAFEQEKNLRALLLQMGSVWQMEAQLTTVFAYHYGFVGDLVGLKRSIEKFESHTRRGYNYHHFLELAHGEYHRLRGEFALARTALERCLEHLHPEALTDTKLALTVLAEVELADGFPDRALQIAQRAIQTYDGRQEMQHLHLRLRSLRVRALAEAKLGRADEAKDSIEKLLVDYEKVDLPPCLRMIYETLATIALEQGDIAAYEKHRQQMESVLLPSENPTLLGRAQVLEDAFARQGWQQTDRDNPMLPDCTNLTNLDTMSSIRLSTSPELVLYSLIELVGTSQVYLFLRHAKELKLVAPKDEREPEEKLIATMHTMLESSQFPTPHSIEEWNLFPLIMKSEAMPMLMGGVAIHNSGDRPSPDVLEQLANNLHQSSEATTQKNTSLRST